VEQTIDHQHPETAPDAGRWRMLKTVALLVAGVFASLLMVELPASGSAEGSDTRRHVRAADKWIPLGSEGSNAVAPAAALARDTVASEPVTGPRSAKRRQRASSKATRQPRRAAASRRRNAEGVRPFASDAAAKHQRRARGV
jgi:hypothetical protein